MPSMNNNPKSKLCNAAAATAGVMILALPILNTGCGRSETSATDAARQEPPGRSKTATEPAARPHSAMEIAVAAPEIPGDAPTLADVYPALSSGALRQARLTTLPEGVLLQAEGVSIKASDLENELSQAPSAMREQLRKNAFFLIEQKATGALLLAKARSAIRDRNIGDDALIQHYFDQLVGTLSVSDADIDAFYEENREMVGGAPLDRVRPAIRQHLLQEKQQELVEQHIRELGRDLPIAISATWVEEQSALARDNPLDRARASGIPTFASFGADSCRPCQMMKPFREAIAEKYGDRLNVVYVHVNKDQILSSRYGVRGIPHVIFFDAEGREVHARTGFMTQDQIEEWIGKIGVRM